MAIKNDFKREKYSECPGCGRLTDEKTGYAIWGATIDTRLEPIDFRIWVACPECKIVFPQVHMTEEEQNRFYETTYRDLTTKNLEGEIQGEARRAERVLSILKQSPVKEVMPNLSWQNTLDVGCGRGQIATMIQERVIGAHIVGITPSGAERDWLTMNKGWLKVYPSIMELGDQTFDTIVCLHVLEHIVWPRVFLKSLFEALRPDGYLILEVPSILGPHGRAMSTIAHNLAFLPSALSNIVTKAGFEEVLIAKTPHHLLPDAQTDILIVARKPLSDQVALPIAIAEQEPALAGGE